MAGAHARPRERAEILTRLINRSDTEPANRESLVLLAHAILEQATVLPIDRLDVRTLVDNAVQGLIPPQSTNAADRLADVGPLVLDLLPDTGRCTDDEQVLLPHALASREFAPPEPMKVTSNVTGPLIWLDENGEPGGTFDVFDYLAICREHYDKVRIGSAVIDGLIR